MATILPSNEECHRRFVEVGEHGSREFFERLRAHAKGHDLLESGFEENLLGQFHELFWELYLAYALHRFGFDLKRGKGQKTEPDYFFTRGSSVIFLEAVACGVPSEPGNRVRSPSLEDDSPFEDGIAPGGLIVQRLAQAIESKIKAVTRPQALQAMRVRGENAVVIALNGCRALNGNPHDDIGVPILPFIVQTLFGASEQQIDQAGNIFWMRSNRKEKTAKSGVSFPFGHFDQSTWQLKNNAGIMETVSTIHIAGVLYSQVSADLTAMPLGSDFLFVQNPCGPEAKELFRFCGRGVWVREGDSLKRLPPIETPP